VTEGVLTRRLLSDPNLKGVDAVVLDEFHERHLDSDFGLALLKRLQRTRPDLRIVVMSATLDAAPVALYLEGCPKGRSQGGSFLPTDQNCWRLVARIQRQCSMTIGKGFSAGDFRTVCHPPGRPVQAPVLSRLQR
jgi:hypothetical protein